MIIAQISDIHAASDNDNLSRLDRALHWLDRLKPDVLVVSGDLIDDNWFEGYGHVRRDTRLYMRCHLSRQPGVVWRRACACG